MGRLKTFYTIRYDTDFQTVGGALDNLIIKHGTPDKLANYIRHVTDMVGKLYAKAEIKEGVFEASIQVPTHKISERWKGVRRHTKKTQKNDENKKDKKSKKRSMQGNARRKGTLDARERSTSD